MSSFGLNQRERDLLVGAFRRHPEIEEVRVFGSRAKGNHESSSDIDLALWGNINSQLLARLVGELDELPLPYTFDLSIYNHVRNRDLKDHIDRVGSTLYRRESSVPRAAN
jgi:predicted nucleotidyltransferase